MGECNARRTAAEAGARQGTCRIDHRENGQPSHTVPLRRPPPGESPLVHVMTHSEARDGHPTHHEAPLARFMGYRRGLIYQGQP